MKKKSVGSEFQGLLRVVMSLWVTVKRDGSILTSSDGINWTPRTKKEFGQMGIVIPPKKKRARCRREVQATLVATPLVQQDPAAPTPGAML